MMDDPEIREIARAQRTRKLKTVAIVLGVLVAGALAVVPTGGSVASALEADGYAEVEVARDGVFAFTFTARRGGSDCSGSVTKMPGSSTRTEMCIQGKPAE